MNLKIVQDSKEDLCKECTRPTLIKSVERSHLEAQVSTISLCRSELVPSSNAQEEEH
jgi:hypothetical protein